MKFVSGLRTLLLTLCWPAVALLGVHLAPHLLAERIAGAEVALLALTSGALVAAGFSQWRLFWGFLLVLTVWAGTRLAGLPVTFTLLPLIALGVLPWLPERGVFGPATLFCAAISLILLALWLRGGNPADLVDQLLLTTLSWRDTNISVAALVVALLLAALLVRLLLSGRAIDIALTGALTALLPATLYDPLSPVATFGACLGAMLALWTGLLLHAWRMAYLDQLTGLPNRRALEDQLKALPARWSLAMLDIDYFKKFNDRYGHDVGDQVLRRVAGTLAGVGERGRAFRYGGEEFSVIFPHDDLERAERAIEALRQSVERQPFQVRDKKRAGSKSRGKKSGQGGQRITISAGLTCARNEPPADTFKRSDQALYKAKSQGRNCVVTRK